MSVMDITDTDARILSEYGVSYLARLSPSTCHVYKGRSSSGLCVVKIGYRADSGRPVDTHTQVYNEYRALLAMLGRELQLPTLLEPNHIKREHDIIALVRRYIKGETFKTLHQRGELRRLPNAQMLRETVAALHEAGFANLEIRAKNVVVSDNKPYLIDLGLAAHREDSRYSANDIHVDNRFLDQLVAEDPQLEDDDHQIDPITLGNVAMFVS